MSLRLPGYCQAIARWRSVSPVLAVHTHSCRRAFQLQASTQQVRYILFCAVSTIHIVTACPCRVKPPQHQLYSRLQQQTTNLARYSSTLLYSYYKLVAMLLAGCMHKSSADAYVASCFGYPAWDVEAILNTTRQQSQLSHRESCGWMHS